MKYKIFQFTLLAFVLISCGKKQEKEKKELNSSRTEVSKTIRCYSYTKEKDTIYLKVINLDDSIVQGNLTYNLYEKDSNRGEFEGKWKGDSLFADYEFQSEGKVSTREIFFYRTDSGMIEGYGPVKDSLNKTVFRDRQTLVLNENILLKPVDCY